MSGDASIPAVGSTLAGKYTVLRTIGQGGMAVVLEARHERLGHRVAVKVLQREFLANAQVTARFEREARTVAALKTRNVARVLDVDTLPDGSPVMVMEMLEGVDLGRELELRVRLPIHEAVQYLLQACSAMTEAHAAGIVHRDLKPSNLFLAETPEGRCVKVLDFGISKLTKDGDQRMTSTHSAFGTPLYMSPEQIRSVKHVDARTDVWSLGVILYEMIAGRPPFEQETATATLVSISVDTPKPLRELREETPQTLADAVMKALSKSPDARWPDVLSFADAIAPFADAGAVDAAPTASPAVSLSSVTRTGADLERRPSRWRVLAIAGALLAVAGAVAFALTRGNDTPGGVTAGPATGTDLAPAPTASSQPPAAPTVAPLGPASAATTPEPPPAPAAPLTAGPKLPTITTAPHKPSAAPTATAAPKPPPTATSETDPKYL